MNQGAAPQAQLLAERDLMEVERAHPQGLSSAQIIQIFQKRGVKLSEATFRKYVQLGLLPRSKRIGSKGKHRGSHGIYPCATVRRINSIKSLMAQSFTIEEIQQRLGSFKESTDLVETTLDELFSSFERQMMEPQFDLALRRELSREVGTARRTANELVRQIIDIGDRITLAHKRQQAAGARALDRDS